MSMSLQDADGAKIWECCSESAKVSFVMNFYIERSSYRSVELLSIPVAFLPWDTYTNGLHNSLKPVVVQGI